MHPSELYLATAGVERQVQLHSLDECSTSTVNLARTSTSVRSFTDADDEMSADAYFLALQGSISIEEGEEDQDRNTINMFDQ